MKKYGPPKEVEQASNEAGDVIGNRFVLASPQCRAGSHWQPNQVMELIEYLCKKFAVDRDRVYLTGFSMGGHATWATACEFPERFAAIVPLAGGGNADQAERLKDLPIWAFHGAKDETVSLKANEAMVDAVRKCGGHAELTTYPDHGHDICGVTYQDQRLYQWLLAQRRGRPASETSSAEEHR